MAVKISIAPIIAITTRNRKITTRLFLDFSAIASRAMPINAKIKIIKNFNMQSSLFGFSDLVKLYH